MFFERPGLVYFTNLVSLRFLRTLSRFTYERFNPVVEEILLVFLITEEGLD